MCGPKSGVNRERKITAKKSHFEKNVQRLAAALYSVKANNYVNIS